MEQNNRVSREHLRAMRDGETRRWSSLDAYGINSARATASMAARLFGCQFNTKADFDAGVIEITRLPKGLKPVGEAGVALETQHTETAATEGEK